MKEVDDYLMELRFRLFGLPRGTINGITKEVRSHIEEHLDRTTGTRADFNRFLRQYGTPKEIARTYKEVYEYSPLYKVLMLVAVIFVASMTLPTMGPSGTLWLLILMGYLVYISIKMGKNTGLLLGVGAAGSRLGTLLYIYTDYKDWGELDPAAAAGFVVTTVLVVLISYFAGEGRERFEDRKLAF